MQLKKSFDPHMSSGTYTQHDLPLVSIAMCTYNGEKFLREQLDSLIAQTYGNIEIIVVDDASTDSTADILQEYTNKHKQLRYTVNEKNLGFNKNFEKALNICSAEYIAISDQDDIWEPNKIAVMMKHWKQGSLFMYSLSGNFSGNDFNDRTAAPNIVYTDIDDIHMLVFDSPVHGHACMFKKELLSLCIPFPPDIFYDWWMSMHAAAMGTIGCVPRTLTWHRVHQSNSSRTLTSIKDKEERNQQLRDQCAYFIETFCKKDILDEPQKRSLLEYAGLLRQLDGKKFSVPMFRYVMKNRELVFHYKRQKPFIIISYVKKAYKMAYKGLL